MSAPVRKIGGSRAAGALGESPWMTPLDVYNECRGEAEAPKNDDDLSADAERGIMLEPALITWASKKLGVEFTKPDSIESEKFAFAAVSPDGLGADGSSYLEIKAPRTHDGYGDEMTDEVPGHVLLQGVHGLMVTERRVCYFGAFIGGTLKIYKMERDLELEAMVIAREKELWAKILAGTPPEPRYGDEGNIRRRYPRNIKPALPFSSLPDAERKTVEQWYEYNRQRVEAEKLEDAWRVSVLNIVGDADGIDGFGLAHAMKRLDLKQNRAAPNGGTWKSVAEELLARLLPDEAKALVAKFTPTEGPRVLRAYPNKLAKKDETK